MEKGNNTKRSSQGLTSEEKTKLKDSIQEINDALTRIEAERDLIKETIGDLSETIGLDKKMLRKIAKVYHNSGFAAEEEEFLNFEQFYSLLFPGK